MRYQFAITREPGPTLDGCISDHPLKKYLNIGLARKQHQDYCKALEELGIELIRLPRDDSYPDGCFVEDTAVVYKRRAFITRLALPRRRGEEEAVMQILKGKFLVIQAQPPATIEGGDVIQLENKLICGITQRTTINGARQLQEALRTPVITLTNEEILHLKSHISYLGNNTMLVTEQFANHPVLKDYQKLIVPKFEKYAANALAVNGVVLMAKAFPKTQEIVREAGFEVWPLDITEFEKCAGALTCLSILF